MAGGAPFPPARRAGRSTFPSRRTVMTERPDDQQDPISRERLEPDHLRAAYDYWCAARGMQPLPPVAALDPTLLPRGCLPWLGVVEVEGEPPRYRSRVVGTAVAEALGIDHTGRYLDEIPGMASQLVRIDRCRRDRRPYLAEAEVTFAPHDFRRYRSLTLPFGGPEGVQRLVFVFAFLPRDG